MNKPEISDTPPRVYLDENWDPDDFDSLDALFRSLHTNALFEDQLVIYIPYIGPVFKTIPNGNTIKEAISLWVPSRLKAWVLDRLKFDVTISDID